MNKFIKRFLNDGSNRTSIANKNIAGTFIVKGFSILISLLLVPLTIDYVSPTEYGIWITLSSFLTWFAFFDIGFGNGLKNRLAIALAHEDYDLAKKYVSTTYFILIIISLGLVLIITSLNFFVDWGDLLNAPQYLHKEIQKLVLVVFVIFGFQFVLQLINVVSAARQNVFISSVINLLANLLSLIVIYILTKTTTGSLYNLGFVVSFSPVVIFLVFTFYLYNSKYREFSPSYKLIRLKYAKDLMGIGAKFFVIQIGLILFYNMDNIIISNVVSAKAVTSYAVAFKYFSILNMICNIIMAPFWPAFTDAYAKGDNVWIRATVKKLFNFFLGIAALGVFMLICSRFAYNIWLGDKVEISFGLSTILFIFTVVNCYRTIYCYYLNGIGKIEIQLVEILIAGILNVPLAILLGKNFGVEGVIAATTIISIACCFVEIKQYRLLINNRAKGIWNR